MLSCASSGACSEQSEESPSLLWLRPATIAAYVCVRLIPQCSGSACQSLTGDRLWCAMHKVSPYQCAPQGKQIARLASGTFYKAVYFPFIFNVL